MQKHTPTGIPLARHLLSRTGFGGRPDEIAHVAGLPYSKVVDSLLAGLRTTHQTTAPAFIAEPLPTPWQRRAMTRQQRRQMRKKYRGYGRELQAWWFREMVTTDSPLTERLVLMWHNHFTSDLRKARWPTLMYRQNQTFRKHAAGNFRALLEAILFDPAMLLYLDNQQNRAGRANENLARELLELFTLGIGHYTEQDIKEVARALTGFMVDRSTGKTIFRRHQHDDGDKVIFGKRGAFAANDLPGLLLQRPRTSEYIAARVYREFVGQKPSPAEQKRLGALFRKADYDLRPLLRAVLTSNGFTDPAGFGTVVQSPVELLASTLRVLRLPVMEWQAVAQASRRLGQHLFQPPNVKGWAGGTAWIQAATLLGRNAIVRRALRGMEAPYASWDTVGRWLGTPNAGRAAMRAHAERVLLPIKPVVPSGTAPIEPIDLFEQIMLDPAYQLK